MRTLTLALLLSLLILPVTGTRAEEEDPATVAKRDSKRPEALRTQPRNSCACACR